MRGAGIWSNHPVCRAFRSFEAAQSELEAALGFARQLPANYPCQALSLSDLALVAELRALEMQQASQLLIKVFLPIFSFLAALLPFALFVHFIKSRDKVTSARGEDQTVAMAFSIKSGLLISWFALIVTGWTCLHNIGLGVSGGLTDPATMAFFSALGVFVLACGLMLRYMPPYRSFSLKRTLVRSGFGGALLLTKAVAIYLGLCFSLAGHPALKDVLFFQSA